MQLRHLGDHLRMEPTTSENADKVDNAAVDVLLICALKDEYDHVRAVTNGLLSPGWVEHPGPDRWMVADGNFATSTDAALSIRATWAEHKGREQVQAVASMLIQKQPAHCIAMSGICAGRRGKVALGDVIFAERLWSYDAGKVTKEAGEEKFQGDELQYRPLKGWVQRMQHLTISPEDPWLTQRPLLPLEHQEDWILLRVLANEDPIHHADLDVACPDWTEALKRLWKREWLEEKSLTLTPAGQQRAIELSLCHFRGLPAPPDFKVHVAPIATGAAVVEDAGIFLRLARSMREVLGVEMEASALGALGEAHGVPVVVAKGVSDYGDTFKDDRYRHFAARAAAECLIALLRGAADLLLGRNTRATTTPKDPDLPLHMPMSRLHPWAGTDKMDVPSPMLMFDACAATPNPMPLNLGTLWGLDRGCFVGLLVGPPIENLCDELRYTERVLDEAQTPSLALSGRLPARWWLEVNPARCPGGPQNAKQLAQSAISGDDLLVTHVAEHGFPAGILPGIVMTMLADAPEQWTETVVQWCRALVNRVFTVTAPAVVAYITGPDNAAASQRAMKLSERLKGLAVPVERMTLCRYRRLPAASVRNAQATPAAAPGFYLFCWLCDATKDGTFWRREQHEYSDVARKFQELESRFSKTDQPVTPGSAGDVITDVDELVGDNQVFHRQFLRLVALRSPELLSTLVHSYAQSRWPTARREALIVASQADLSADLDTLLDAWIAGSRLIPEHFPKAEELVPEPGQRPFVDSLTLAVLRQHGMAPVGVHDVLASLPHDLEKICRLRFGEMSLDDFLAEAGNEEYLLAYRAGVEMGFSIDRYADRLGMWWLLMATPPSRDRVADLLLLSREDRAVLGLVTAEEWEEMSSDKGLRNRVVEYRCGRPLYRRS